MKRDDSPPTDDDHTRRWQCHGRVLVRVERGKIGDREIETDDAWQLSLGGNRGEAGVGPPRPFALRQLSFAPSLIHALIASRSQMESFFLPSGIWVSGAPRHSSSQIRLLESASPGITILPDFVPFMTPS